MNNPLEQSTDQFCKECARIERAIAKGFLTPADALRPLGEAAETWRAEKRRLVDGQGYPAEQLKELQVHLQAFIELWFSQSWFMHRARTKPRGYPGDYEILESIYNNQARSKGFGETLDLFLLSTELSVAVRERKNFLRRALDEFAAGADSCRVLNIASGPCREVVESERFRKHPNLHYVALDHDDAALEYGKKRLDEAGIPADRLDFRKYNALRLTSTKRNAELFGQFDLIYSVGLFDYLPDDVLVKIITGTQELLVPGGSYILAFKDANRYDATWYQWFTDWYFHQRTEGQCRDLLKQTGGWPMAMARDASGIIMFFTITRPMQTSAA